MFSERTSVGLDVHARSIVACGLDTVTGQLYRQRLTPAFEGVLAWLATLAGPVAVVYEAEPTRVWAGPQLTAAGARYVVAAPSKSQRPAGDRVKPMAGTPSSWPALLRMDQLSAVRVPGPAEEAARDLVRAREDCRGDLMRARHRLSKMLLRQGIVWNGGAAWTGKHEQWLRGQHFDPTGLHTAYDTAFETVLMTGARRDRLDEAIGIMAGSSEYTPTVRRLACLRGVSTLTAFGLAVEIGDWHRFSGSTIGAYVGLVPTERSSGGTRSQGSITKTGNTHARRLLVEAAWHHSRPYRTPGLTMQARWAPATPAAKARGHEGNRRLADRWQVYHARKKRPVIANVAIARELAGWCWSLATLN